MTNKEEALLYNIAFSMLGGVTEASKLVMLRHYGSATGIYNLRKKNTPIWPIEAAEEEINFALEAMAKQIEADFFDDVPDFIGVLNGSFMVVSDLLKKYNQPCEVSFVKMASYEGTQTTNEVKQLIGINQNLEGRSVIIVEDIVDTGNTIEELKAILGRGRAKKGMFEGDLDAGELEVGQVSGTIHKIMPAKEIVAEIIREFKEAQNNQSKTKFIF
jgi:pyrimidine operon attenuation protein/uracil phosphoribosyltransferase